MASRDDRVAVELDRGRLQRRERRDARAIAASVFSDDELFAFLFPDPVRRRRGVGLLHAGLLAAAPPVAMLSSGAEAGHLVGLSMWVPPGRYPYPRGFELRTGLQSLRLAATASMAIVPGAAYMANVVAAHLRSPHWYLQLVMVDPANQGRGLGAALLAPGLTRADAAGLPCYLETQRHDNLAYYARFGFEVSATFGGTDGLPRMWAMTRPPRVDDHADGAAPH